MPAQSALGHAVENGKEFSQAGSQLQLSWFTLCRHALGKVPEQQAATAGSLGTFPEY